jgi:glycosyltransferase involved in cell wall biosynthesis
MSNSMPRIKVIQIVTRMNTGGVAVLVEELITGLDPALFEVYLITGECSKDEEDYLTSRGINLSHISIRSMKRSLNPFRDFVSFVSIYRLLRSINPDIVHSHTSKAGLLARISAKFANPHILLIHTFHGHLLHGYFSRLTTALLTTTEKGLARITNVLIAMGNEVKTNLLDAGIGTAKQFQVVFPGVRLKQPDLRNPETLKFRASHPDEIIFTFVGRLSQIKRCDRIIELAHEIYQKNVAAHFLLIGDGELRKELESRAAGLPITFIGWKSCTEDWLAISNCAILLSENEAVPLAMIEAGLAGLPVIATNVGSMGDVVKDGLNGYLVSENLSEILEKVLALAQSKELRESFGRKGRELALLNFSVERMSEIHSAIYSQVYLSRF